MAHDHRRRPPRREGPRLYGRHAVLAALNNPARTHTRLYATARGLEALAYQGREYTLATDQELDRLLPPGTPHQGVVLECAPLDPPALHDVLTLPGTLVMLDQVTDPQNIGAIMRAAVAFGAAALITQDRHTPNESGALAKAASGALECLPWCRVTNLARALDDIAEAGFWRIGLSGHASVPFASVCTAGRLCLVLGAEGAGLRPNVADHCDGLARLPISDKVESLNVSTAAAVALYAIASAADATMGASAQASHAP